MDLKSSASAPAASGPVAAATASGPVAAATAPGPVATATSGTASAVEPGLPLIRSEGESPYGSLVSTVLTLALVGAAVIWALRRSGWAARRAAQPSTRMLQVRETVHVAPKVRVTYLRCGEHELLLAHSEHSQAWITLPPATRTVPPAPAPQDPTNAA